MSNTEDFDQELIAMWQEKSFPAANETTAQLASWVEKFDRRIFWRNFIEYAAAVVVLVRTGFEIAAGDRHIIAPLTSIAAVIFIVGYVWWKHRNIGPIDPSADASSYRAALLARIDRQIQLTRRVRYWYILPAWVFFLTVFVSGTIRVLSRPPQHIPTANAVLGLAVDFLLATAICVVVIWINERFGLRKLQEERGRVLQIHAGLNEGDPE